MENNQEEIIEIALDRLGQEEIWFTTKDDKLYANAKDLYKLDQYGELEVKSKERLVKEVEQYLGDGASFIIEAVDQWIQDNLAEGILGYTDNLLMNFEIKEVVEETKAFDEVGVDDLETTVAEEADEPEKEKKEESKKVEAYNYYWRDDVLEVEPDESNDDIWYAVAENIQQTDPDYKEWDVYEIMSDIICLWKIEKRSRLYDYLLKWYGSEENLLKNVRDVYDTNYAIYFVTGIGYAIMSADLLGGTADGNAEREFDQFVNNGGVRKEEESKKVEESYPSDQMWDIADKIIDEFGTDKVCRILGMNYETEFGEIDRLRQWIATMSREELEDFFPDFAEELDESKIVESAGDYSKPVKVNGKLFRYNYKYNEVEYITHESNEFGPIEVIDSVGLSKENWENKEARNEYLQGWIAELDEEAERLAGEFLGENKKLTEGAERDFDAYKDYIMDNIYCDSETLETSEEIIKDNIRTISRDAAEQVVNEILGEQEYTGLWHGMVKDYQEVIKDVILNNIDKIVFLQNEEQQKVNSLITEGLATDIPDALKQMDAPKPWTDEMWRKYHDECLNNYKEILKYDKEEERGSDFLLAKAKSFGIETPEGITDDVLEDIAVAYANEKEKRYNSVNFSEALEVKNEKKPLTEGARQRLDERNEQSADIIEKALQGITAETSEQESGIINKTSELFQQLSDRGYDVQVSFDNGESTSSIAIGQQGANVLITITDAEQPLRAFASGNFEINDDSLKMIKSIMEVLK